MKLVRFRSFIAFLCNALIFVFVLNCVIGFFFTNGQGNMKVSGVEAFMFYTVDSNVFAALVALIMIPYNIKGMTKGKLTIPKWLALLRFMSVVAIIVTLVTVLVFLGPTMGFDKMFERNNLYMHLICPIMTICTFWLCECGASKITLLQSMTGVIPVAIYGTLYVYNVIIVKYWDDFYTFTSLGNWQAVCACFIVIVLYCLC